MDKTAQKFSEASSGSEMNRLDLIEKKVEIQRKKLEIKREKLLLEKILMEKNKDIQELKERKIAVAGKRLENKRARIEIEELFATLQIEKERMLNDKIFSVLLSLVATTIDDEKTILGSEPMLMPVISGKKREVVINKLINLISCM